MLEATAKLDQLYTVMLGDSLSKLAQRFYGDASKYPLIAQRNALNAGAPLIIGKRLIIPGLRDELTEVQVTAQRLPEVATPTAEIGPEVVTVTASVWYKDWRYWAAAAAGVGLLLYFTRNRS